MRAELLARLPAGAAATVLVELRWLQIVERRLATAGPDRPGFVPELTARGERYVAWTEATERSLALPPLRLEPDVTVDAVIDVPAGSTTEPIDADDGSGGLIVRHWRAVTGTLTARAARIAPDLFRLTIVVRNRTAWTGTERDDALRSSLNSSHLAVRTDRAAFVSLTDPPPELDEVARELDQIGCWPVLVGSPGRTDAMLAAPIILSDYPAIAPESPGDLFDGGEIDELLALNILGLTDAEKAAMRAADPATRAILERTEALTAEQMLRLHGRLRELR